MMGAPVKRSSLVLKRTLAVFLAICLGAAASAADPPTPAKTDKDPKPARTAHQDPLVHALVQLTAEARTIDIWKKPVEHPPRFAHPHPALAAVDGSRRQDVLHRIVQPFTNNPYRDAYIRWHLLTVYRKSPVADRRGDVHELIELLNLVPDDALPGIPRKTEHYYDPPDLWALYRRLSAQPSMTVGYPPFQKVIRGPQAFEELSKAAQAQYRKNWDMAAKIHPRLKQRTDERAVSINKRIDARNNRVHHLNLIIRQLRGQVLYLLVQTGDSTVLELIGKSIERYIKARSHAAFDMMAYLYRAMSEGYLAQYDKSTLEAFGDRLRVIARANQRYVKYSGVTRNFGDYAFHLIETLKEPARLKPPRQLDPADP